MRGHARRLIGSRSRQPTVDPTSRLRETSRPVVATGIPTADLIAAPRSSRLPGATSIPGWVDWINAHLVRGDHPYYMALYTALILFFTFFYVSITFNPTEVADNMKKYGGFIPGIRAGRPTAEYLSYVLTRITVPGALYLAFVSLLPLIALVLVGANQNFPFGGTSILIVVGVGLETVKQIEAQLQQRHYEGFLR